MTKERRIGTDNGFLLACYFIPGWAAAALKIWEAPIWGLYQRANIGPAVFIGDTLQLSGVGMARFAWFLALAKITTVVFFALFLVLSWRKTWRNAANGEEALSIALIIGTAVSFASMVCASHTGETEALRLHATETMLLLGGAVVLLLQSRLPAASAPQIEQATPQAFSSPSS